MPTIVTSPEGEDEKSTSHYTMPQANQERSATKRRYDMGERTQSIEAKVDNKQQEKTDIPSNANSWLPNINIMPYITEIPNVLKAGGTEDFILMLALIGVVYRARFTSNKQDNPWINFDVCFFYLALSVILLRILYRTWQSNIKRDLEQLKKEQETDKVKHENFERKYDEDKLRWANKFEELEKAADKRENYYRDQIKKLSNAEDDLRKIWEDRFQECMQQLYDMRKENESLRRQQKN